MGGRSKAGLFCFAEMVEIGSRCAFLDFFSRAKSRVGAGLAVRSRLRGVNSTVNKLVVSKS